MAETQVKTLLASAKALKDETVSSFGASSATADKTYTDQVVINAADTFHYEPINDVEISKVLLNFINLLYGDIPPNQDKLKIILACSGLLPNLGGTSTDYTLNKLWKTGGEKVEFSFNGNLNDVLDKVTLATANESIEKQLVNQPTVTHTAASISISDGKESTAEIETASDLGSSQGTMTSEAGNSKAVPVKVTPPEPSSKPLEKYLDSEVESFKTYLTTIMKTEDSSSKLSNAFLPQALIGMLASVLLRALAKDQNAIINAFNKTLAKNYSRFYDSECGLTKIPLPSAARIQVLTNCLQAAPKDKINGFIAHVLNLKIKGEHSSVFDYCFLLHSSYHRLQIVRLFRDAKIRMGMTYADFIESLCFRMTIGSLTEVDEFFQYIQNNADKCKTLKWCRLVDEKYWANLEGANHVALFTVLSWLNYSEQNPGIIESYTVRKAPQRMKTFGEDLYNELQDEMINTNTGLTDKAETIQKRMQERQKRRQGHSGRTKLGESTQAPTIPASSKTGQWDNAFESGDEG